MIIDEGSTKALFSSDEKTHSLFKATSRGELCRRDRAKFAALRL